jgi:cell division protein FtsW
MTAWVATARERGQELAAQVSAWFGRGAHAVGITDQLRAARPAGGPDRLLCGAALSLMALGVVMVFSAGAAFAAKTYGDWTFFLKREAIYGVLGLCGFTFAMRTDYSIYRRLTYPLLFLALGLLAGVLLIGSRAGGAVRWFKLGPLSFQPSELAKFALVLYLAVLLARKADKVRQFSMGFLPPLLMTGMFLGLLLLQPDLGTAVILGVTALGLLFVAGTRADYLLLAMLVAAPVGWKVFITGTPWRMRRMLAFLNPWQFRREGGYQLYESLITVGSGGFLGQGLGHGRQKLFFLPEAHTDFILAIVGEELGLVGIFFVLVGFGVLVWRGLVAAARARDVFGSYLAFGLSCLFGLQALVNMAVVMGLLPTKGLPLPFISYGGTALVMSLFMAGVLANISARNPEPRHMPLLQALRFRGPRVKNKKAGGLVKIVVHVGPWKRTAPVEPAESVAIVEEVAPDDSSAAVVTAMEEGSSESDEVSVSAPAEPQDSSPTEH